MVRYCLFFLIGLSCALWADVKVRIETDPNGITENQPFIARLLISREQGQTIDDSSIKMEGKKLEVQRLGDSTSSSISILNGVRSEKHSVTTTYQFEMPAMSAGVHLMPPIQVLVDGRLYHSQQTTYSVVRPEENQDFRLELSVGGALPVFPGQELSFIHRIYYVNDVELTGDYLPMLAAEGFQKIGEEGQRKYRRQGFQIWEITQNVLALAPGEYSFGPSYVEGRFVQRDFFGRKRYVGKKMRASAETLSIEVKPFPEEGKPELFEGAVGVYEVSAQLLTQGEVSVGDKLEVEVVVEGEGAFSTVKLPDLKMQPGFLDRFRMSDLPDPGVVDGRVKRFKVELRPLDAQIRQIPPITFAFFDPLPQKYQVRQTEPIPIEVQQLAELPLPDSGSEGPPSRSDGTAIGGVVALSDDSLQPPFYRTSLALWLLVLSLFGLAAQWVYKGVLIKRVQNQPEEGVHDLLAKAGESEEWQQLVEQGLLRALREKGFSDVESPYALEQKGVEGEIREFLCELQEHRFAQDQGMDRKVGVDRAIKLLGRLG